ncbi:hypothetical protein GCM10025782_20420 [Pedococcus ginsenosidimutans]|uniref:Uncharacterized protein n=1 Tax=Pedococcus ginsenosidimutans TaxID=490570 RepID=A0ABP8Y8F2_9MICO
MRWVVGEVCQTVRTAIVEKGRTGRLIAIIITMTVCVVIVKVVA